MWDKVEQTSTRTFCLHKTAISYFFIFFSSLLFATNIQAHSQAQQRRTVQRYEVICCAVIFFTHFCNAAAVLHLIMREQVRGNDYNCTIFVLLLNGHEEASSFEQVPVELRNLTERFIQINLISSQAENSRLLAWEQIKSFWWRRKIIFYDYYK